MEDIAGTIFSPYTHHLMFWIVTYTISLSDKEKFEAGKKQVKKIN